jgi:hypothetical protein
MPTSVTFAGQNRLIRPAALAVNEPIPPNIGTQGQKKEGQAMVAMSKAFGLVVAAVIAATLLTPRPAGGAPPQQGGDLPGQSCQRNNKDGSITTGLCSNVCKNLDVSTTKDVNTGKRTCTEALSVPTRWGLVAVSGSSLTRLLRFSDTGEVQTCTLTKADEMQCYNVTIREVNTKSK